MASLPTRVGLPLAVASFTVFVGFVLTTPVFLVTWAPRRRHSLLHLRTRSQRAPERGNCRCGACSSRLSLSLAASTSSVAKLRRTRHLDSRKSRCFLSFLFAPVSHPSRTVLHPQRRSSRILLRLPRPSARILLYPSCSIVAHVLPTISRSSRILISLCTFFALFLLLGVADSIPTCSPACTALGTEPSFRCS